MIKRKLLDRNGRNIAAGYYLLVSCESGAAVYGTGIEGDSQTVAAGKDYTVIELTVLEFGRSIDTHTLFAPDAGGSRSSKCAALKADLAGRAQLDSSADKVTVDNR